MAFHCKCVEQRMTVWEASRLPLTAPSLRAFHASPGSGPLASHQGATFPLSSDRQKDRAPEVVTPSAARGQDEGEVQFALTLTQVGLGWCLAGESEVRREEGGSRWSAGCVSVWWSDRGGGSAGASLELCLRKRLKDWNYDEGQERACLPWPQHREADSQNPMCDTFFLTEKRWA